MVSAKPPMRPTRAKRSLIWERFELESDGFYAVRLKQIARLCPNLTPTQLRVCTLIASMLPSHEIARILCVSEHAIEKVRSRIRRKLNLAPGESLSGYLLSLTEKNQQKNVSQPQIGRQRGEDFFK